MIKGRDTFSDVFIRQVTAEHDVDNNAYPFNIPAVQAIESIKFDTPVTFLVGENGSGKSTIIESIAVAAGFDAEGGTKNYSFATVNTVSKLHESIGLIRGARKEKTGFFLRAESFYNVASEAERVEMQYGASSFHTQSHGESFLALANHQFKPNGLYILDEPEAALSPQRQLAFLTRMHDLASQGSQFIVATHSPILLAYPNASIYELDQQGVSKVTYEETELYKLTLDFLSHHKAYTARLFES